MSCVTEPPKIAYEPRYCCGWVIEVGVSCYRTLVADLRKSDNRCHTGHSVHPILTGTGDFHTMYCASKAWQNVTLQISMLVIDLMICSPV